MAQSIWILLCATVLLYAGLVLALLVAGRRTDARAWAGFIPDCVALFKRLVGDGRLPRRHKLLLVVVMAYVASPLDLVPDFIPIAGQLDDALIVAGVLRVVLRAAGGGLLREHWPGPEASLNLLLRLTRRPLADEPC